MFARILVLRHKRRLLIATREGTWAADSKGDEIEELLAAKPAAKLFVMYGQTEVTARLSYLPPDKLQAKPDYECFIADGGWGALESSLPDPSVAADLVTEDRSVP